MIGVLIGLIQGSTDAVGFTLGHHCQPFLPQLTATPHSSETAGNTRAIALVTTITTISDAL